MSGLTDWERNYLVGVLARAARGNHWHDIDGYERYVIYIQVEKILKRDMSLEEHRKEIQQSKSPVNDESPINEENFEKAKGHALKIFDWVEQAKEEQNEQNEKIRQIRDGAPYTTVVLPNRGVEAKPTTEQYVDIIDDVGPLGSRLMRHERLNTDNIIVMNDDGYELLVDGGFIEYDSIEEIMEEL